MTRVYARLSPAIMIMTMIVALLLPSPAQGAPNPYGQRSTATAITLDSDGSYRVTLRESQDLFREYEIGFGGSVHDGFRLPDDGSVLPPYLRAEYTLTSATWENGQTAPTAFTRTNHRWSAASSGTYPAGTHSAELGYRVTGAARPTPRGWAVHVRLLGVRYVAGDTVTVEAGAVREARLELRCVTHAPDSEPCGTTAASTLRYVFPDERVTGVPPEFVIKVTGDNRRVPEPTIDRN
jgi:hypothetical protein